MAKLVSHTSKLKGDDLRLNSLQQSFKACSERDLFLKEDLFHVVMQYPKHYQNWNNMHYALYQYDEILRRIFADNVSDKVYLGHP